MYLSSLAELPAGMGEVGGWQKASSSIKGQTSTTMFPGEQTNNLPHSGAFMFVITS